MPTPSSRPRRAGDTPDALGRAEFAAAFLQRNQRYRADCADMRQRIDEGQQSEVTAQAALARRWGLSFRGNAG